MFQWLKKFQRRAVAITSPQAYSLLADAPTSSGLRLNRKSVLSSPPVWRGVNLISQSVAKLPMFVYRRGADDSREKDSKHPAFKLLRRQPSEFYTALQFKFVLQSHALVFGNGYAYILRDEAANPIELLILDPEETYPIKEGGRLMYVTWLDSVQYKIDAADILHIKGLSLDNGITGASLLDVMRDALGLSLALQKYGSVYFKNNARPSMVIELPAGLRDPERIEHFRRTWGEVHAGLENAHRPALLESGAKLQTIGGDNDAGQYIQSREFDLVMVADILGIPPSYLGSSVNTSYSSLEMDQRNFLSTGLDFWLHEWEEQCEQKLLSETQKNLGTHFVEFERKGLIAIDAATESRLLIDELNNGVLAWEEVRKLRNRSTDTDGLTFRRPANIVIDGEPATPPEATRPQSDQEAEPQPEDQEAEPQPEDQEAEPQPEDQDGRFRRLVLSILERNLRRLGKAASKAARSDDWSGWLADGLEADHRAVFVESIKPAFPDADQIADEFFSDLKAELEAASRHDIDKIFRHKLANTEHLWKYVQSAAK